MILLFVAAMATPFGCRTIDRAEPPAVVDIQGPLSGAEPITAAQLHPFVPHHGLIHRSVGHSPGKTVRYRLEPDRGDHWRWTLEGVRMVHLHHAEMAAVVILMERELSEAVAVTYDPPLVILPNVLTMDQPVEQESQVTVTGLKDGSPRDQGRCRHRVQLLGKRTITTPAGTFQAYVVQTRREMDLQLAQVSVVSETAYAPGRGWVAEQIVRVTKPMKLFAFRQIEQLHLVD